MLSPHPPPSLPPPSTPHSAMAMIDNHGLQLGKLVELVSPRPKKIRFGGELVRRAPLRGAAVGGRVSAAWGGGEGGGLHTRWVLVDQRSGLESPCVLGVCRYFVHIQVASAPIASIHLIFAIHLSGGISRGRTREL